MNWGDKMLTEKERDVVLSICRTLKVDPDAAMASSGMSAAAFAQYVLGIKEKTGCDVETFAGAAQVLAMIMFGEM